MRFGLAVPLLLAFADATPQAETVDETRWKEGDFVALANEPWDKVVESGDTVGLQISGRGESCLVRNRSYPLRFPCKLTFRVRWTESKFDHAYPSLHVFFNPSDFARTWDWKKGWDSFLFHFSTDEQWKQLGLTSSLQSAYYRHDYSSAKEQWVDLSILLERDQVTVSTRARTVATVKADLSRFSRFTYGIGDQTSTYVELDAFRAAGGR